MVSGKFKSVFIVLVGNRGQFQGHIEIVSAYTSPLFSIVLNFTNTFIVNLCDTISEGYSFEPPDTTVKGQGTAQFNDFPVLSLYNLSSHGSHRCHGGQGQDRTKVILNDNIFAKQRINYMCHPKYQPSLKHCRPSRHRFPSNHKQFKYVSKTFLGICKMKESTILDRKRMSPSKKRLPRLVHPFPI